MLEIIAQAPASQPNPLTGLLPMIFIMVAFYFFLIAPQRKRQKQHQAMIENLQPGDRIITNGGLYATVERVKKDRLLVQLGESLKVEMAKSFVQSKIDPKKESDAS